jgi:hypothetical protein
VWFVCTLLYRGYIKTLLFIHLFILSFIHACKKVPNKILRAGKIWIHVKRTRLHCRPYFREFAITRTTGPIIIVWAALTLTTPPLSSISLTARPTLQSSWYFFPGLIPLFSTWPDDNVPSSQLNEHRGIASACSLSTCHFIGARPISQRSFTLRLRAGNVSIQVKKDPPDNRVWLRPGG